MDNGFVELLNLVIEQASQKATDGVCTPEDIQTIRETIEVIDYACKVLNV